MVISVVVVGIAGSHWKRSVPSPAVVPAMLAAVEGAGGLGCSHEKLSPLGLAVAVNCQPLAGTQVVPLYFLGYGNRCLAEFKDQTFKIIAERSASGRRVVGR